MLGLTFLINLFLGALFWVAVQAAPTAWISHRRKREFFDRCEAEALFAQMSARDASLKRWNLLSNPYSPLAWKRRLRDPGTFVGDTSWLDRATPVGIKPPRAQRRRRPAPSSFPSPSPSTNAIPADDILQRVPSHIPKVKSARLQWYFDEFLASHPGMDTEKLYKMADKDEQKRAVEPFARMGPRFLVPSSFLSASPSPPTGTVVWESKVNENVVIESNKMASMPTEPTDHRNGTPLVGTTSCVAMEESTDLWHGTPPPAIPLNFEAAKEPTDLWHGTPSMPTFLGPCDQMESTDLWHGTPSPPTTPSASATTEEAIDFEHDPLLPSSPVCLESQEPQQVSPLPSLIESQEPVAFPLPADTFLPEFRPSTPVSVARAESQEPQASPLTTTLESQELNASPLVPRPESQEPIKASPLPSPSPASPRYQIDLHWEIQMQSLCQALREWTLSTRTPVAEEMDVWMEVEDVAE